MKLIGILSAIFAVVMLGGIGHPARAVAAPDAPSPTVEPPATKPERDCRYQSDTTPRTHLIDRVKFWSKMTDIVQRPETFSYDFFETVKVAGKPVLDVAGKPVKKKRHEAISFNYSNVRSIVKDEQKCTIEGIFDYWELSGGGDARVLALALATAMKESNYTLDTAYEEKFGTTNRPPYAVPDKHGLAYYGRGLTQLTKIANYRTFEKRLGIPLVKHPELATERAHSIRILVDAARLSLFNTRYGKVETYLSPTRTDWVRARGLVNPGSYRKRTVGYLSCRLYDAVQPAYLVAAPEQDPGMCMELRHQVEDEPLTPEA